jgi:hypothetical protein
MMPGDLDEITALSWDDQQLQLESVADIMMDLPTPPGQTFGLVGGLISDSGGSQHSPP